MKDQLCKHCHNYLEKNQRGLVCRSCKNITENNKRWLRQGFPQPYLKASHKKRLESLSITFISDTYLRQISGCRPENYAKSRANIHCKRNQICRDCNNSFSRIRPRSSSGECLCLVCVNRRKKDKLWLSGKRRIRASAPNALVHQKRAMELSATFLSDAYLRNHGIQSELFAVKRQHIELLRLIGEMK